MMRSPQFQYQALTNMIHKALRLIRQYHERTQADLSAELKLSKDKLVELESGNLPVSGDLLKRYSEIFDIPVPSLVLFSESIGKEGKYSKKIRKMLAGKALDVLQWMVMKNETTKVKA